MGKSTKSCRSDGDRSIRQVFLISRKPVLASAQQLDCLKRSSSRCGSIASQLGFPIPGSLKREMAFEDIAGTHPHIRMVDQVELTQSVAQSIEPLIALDEKLYTFAAEEFTKSLGILRSISVSCR